jgi:PIN domain nuclease of toxin-antitoxin system
MKVLVDTQSFIWFVEDNEKLPDSIRIIMEEPDNILFISIACLWEITIKMSLEKLKLSGNIETIIEQTNANGFEILPIEPKHLITLATLKFANRDPFDRIMIAQAITENIPVISSDSIFGLYPVKCLWRIL